MRALLARMRLRHHAYAAMHSASSRSAAAFHRNLTVAILIVSLSAALTTTGLQGLDSRWATVASEAALAIVAGLTAINNFLGYQKREEQHRAARESHLRAASLIDIAIACDDEDTETTYDYTDVLREIQEIHDSLRQISVEIPGRIARKFPEYEAPWLLRDNV